MGLAKGRDYHTWTGWQAAGGSPLTNGLPWELFPQTRFMDYERWPEGDVLARLGNGKPLLLTNTLGKGRTVTLTYDVLTHDMPYRGYSALTPILSYRGAFMRNEFREMTWRYWEAWYALLARLSVWAAGRDTGVRIAHLAPVDGAPHGTPGQLALALEGGQGRYQVTADFENRCGRPIGRTQAVYTPGQEQVLIPRPANLGAGINLVSIIVRDAAGASVAWAQTWIRAWAPVAIKSVRPEKEIVLGERAPRAGQPYDRAFRAREPFRVDVALALAADDPRVDQFRVRAQLYDTHHRLLFEETRPVQAGTSEMRFEARPAELRSMGLEWEITVLGRAGQADIATAKVICPWPRDWNRFRLSSWSGIYLWRSEYLFRYLAPLVEDLQEVAIHGATELSTGHVWRHYWHNMEWGFLGLLSYMGQGIPDFMDKQFAEKAAKYSETHDKQWLVRTPSLSDAEWRAKVAAHMQAQAKLAMPFGGAYDYCMGDEMSLTYYTQYFDFDWSPHSLRDFRKWLQARYPSLEALNRAWETSFATWDAVVPMTLQEAQGRANAAPWCEFRDFMNDVVADFYAMVQATLKKVDPKARVGLSGTQEPRAGNGMDWWKNSKAFNYYHAYNTGWSNEMRRSFARETGVAQSPYYAGYWQAGRAAENNLFWCLLHDTNGVSAWATPILFYNDFTYSESGRDTRALCHEMKRGIWDLIRSARRLHDGIAIHYSHSSINAAHLLGKEEQIVVVRDAWVKLIEDLGLQYDFVATPQIEAGALVTPATAKRGNGATGQAGLGRYRMLILPQSLAISDKEKAQIEAFVRAGGTVIADRDAGLMDGKCRRRPAGMLDSLFGIRRSQGSVPAAIGASVRLPRTPAIDLKLPAAEAVQVTTARSYGSLKAAKAPVVTCNTFGKGSAWYLNLDLTPFDNERVFHTPTEKGLRSAMKAILAGAGVKPQVSIALASGRAPHVEVVRYAAGELRYIGLLSGVDREEMARVTFPQARYVYDCRKGEALGKHREVRATLVGGQARVYCLSPKPLLAPRLALAGGGVKPGGAVAYTVALPGGSDARKQLVRLTVLRPDGSEYGDYARNLLLGSKAFSGSFRLALNDPPGKWRVVARDLCSSQKATAALTVRATSR